MAGPLIRVDTDGRGTLLKMTAGEAAKYVASHAGASIWGAKPVAAEPDTAQFVEPAAQSEAKPGLGSMTKAELQAEAESRGLPTSGTKAELAERLAAADESALGDELNPAIPSPETEDDSDQE